MRGMWADAFGPGFKNKAEVKQLVEDCRKFHFNAVFVQMRKRGDAYYFPKSPNTDVRATDIDPDYDALAEIIKACHNAEPRIEVHCWAVAYFVWAFDKPPVQSDHVFNKRPDLLTKDFIGQTVVANGNYLDPGHPEVSQLLLNMAKDVTERYDIDGFHWDYLRYPLRDSGYNDVAVKRYQEEFKTDQRPMPEDVRFIEWRRRQVTDFLRWSSAELLRIKPKLVISASVFSGYKDSLDYRMADWVAWNQEGLLDASVPMDFSPHNESVFNPRADFAAQNPGCRMVWNGLGAYMNTKENTVQQMKYSRDRGFPGYLFYSYRNSSPDVSLTGKKKAEERKFKGRRQVVVDNSKAKAEGDWSTGEFGKMHGDDYLFKPVGDGKGAVTFLPHLPVSGEYEVYEWHVMGTNRCKEAMHVIRYGTQTATIKVNQQQDGSRWNLIGSFSFKTNEVADVMITNQGVADGSVVLADAIRFVLVTGTSKPGHDLTEEQIARKSQEEVFEFVQQHVQPKWEPTGAMPWKTTPTNGIVLGTVLEKNGAAIYNAKVTIDSGRAQKTESHGKFALFETPRGDHSITIESDGKRTTKQVNVEAGRVATVEIQF